MLQRKTNFNLGRSSRRARVASSIPIVALLLVGGMVMSALYPIGTLASEAKAEGVSLVATFSSYEPASVMLTMADKVAGEIVPEKDGSFTNLTTTARVNVYNSDYYDLSIAGTSMSNAAKDITINPVIANSKASEFENNTWGYSLVQNAGQASSTASSDTVYQPVPTTNTKIVHQITDPNTKTADDTYTLNFGAKVDSTLPAGSYSSEVVLAVVANPAFMATGFDRVSTMQELTPEICREIGTSADNYGKGYAYTDSLGNTYWTKQLRDERDNKSYWVAKLADGNCWMTQNLALDIPAEGLTSELTALAPGKTSWKPEEATRTPEVENRFSVVSTVLNDQVIAFTTLIAEGKCTTALDCANKYSNHSWDEGEYVLIYPSEGDAGLYFGMKSRDRNIDNDKDGTIQDGLASFGDRGEVVASANKSSTLMTSKVLTDYGVIIDVSDGWIASDDPNFTSGSTYIGNDGKVYTKAAVNTGAGETTEGLAIDYDRKIYDAHYLIGNYYSWLAATAQVVIADPIATESYNVQGSICAKGWELPTGGVEYLTESGSLFSLLKAYAGDALATGGGDGSNAEVNDGSSSLFNVIKQVSGASITLNTVVFGAPMFLARGGVVGPMSNAASNIGHDMQYWTSVVYSDTRAQTLVAKPDTISPTSFGQKGPGRAIRCLVNTAK